MIYDQEEITNFWLPYYKPEALLLKSARLEYPRAYGAFNSSGGSFYIKSGDLLQHMTAIELILCLNQLSGFSLEKWIQMGFLEKTNLEWQRGLIVSCDMKLKRVINPSEDVNGEVHLTKTKKLDRTSFFAFDYSFGESCFYGNLLLAFK